MWGSMKIAIPYLVMTLIVFWAIYKVADRLNQKNHM